MKETEGQGEDVQARKEIARRRVKRTRSIKERQEIMVKEGEMQGEEVRVFVEGDTREPKLW